MKLYLSATSLMALTATAAITWSCGGGSDGKPPTPTPTAAASSTAPTPASTEEAGNEGDDPDQRAPADSGVPGLDPNQPMEIPPGRGENHTTFEMHWGFTEALAVAEDEPSLWLPMDGRIAIDDGDPATSEGIHIISALLFEDDGTYEGGRDDTVTAPEDEAWIVTGTGYFYPWVSWESATTNDWDGMAVSLNWEQGTDPTVTVETDQWTASSPASELRDLATTVSIGGSGQTLEAGEFFTLAWKVYDLALTWGYNPQLDESADTLFQTNEWNGSVAIDSGALYVMHTQNFELADDTVAARGELDPSVSFSTVTADAQNKRGAIDGLALNIIAPRDSRPTLTLTVNGETQQVTLPRHFQDIVKDFSMDSDGHFVQGHLHWCWWKTPDADHV